MDDAVAGRSDRAGGATGEADGPLEDRGEAGKVASDGGVSGEPGDRDVAGRAEDPEDSPNSARREAPRLLGASAGLVRVRDDGLTVHEPVRRARSERSEPPGSPLPETPIDVWAAELPQQLDSRLVLAREPYGPRAAAFRSLRIRLAATDVRVVAVTSAGPGEGKTTCAVNLAMALAEGGGAKTLLVEANFRTPVLARMLGFKPPEGLVAQLDRHREAPRDPWSVVEIVGSRLHVIAVDDQATRPVVLDHVAFGLAMQRLRLAGYDFIVVDTPPVLGSADVNLVVDAVDGVLIATLAQRSTGRSLRQAIEQLDPAPILGAVLVDA